MTLLKFTYYNHSGINFWAINYDLLIDEIDGKKPYIT